jgi:hypothetical protein
LNKAKTLSLLFDNKYIRKEEKMMNNRYIKSILLTVITLILTSQVSIASNQVKWEVMISLYSGVKNPNYQLNNDEVNNLRNMIDTEMKNTTRIASDDKEKHQGRLIEYKQYHKSNYMGISVSARDSSNELIEAYDINGKYIRIYSEGGISSKLFKMKNNNIEGYLIQLANEKGATIEKEQNLLKSDINKREKRN